MSFQIVRNDITRVKADAIVNTANPMPICGSGTDYAIYQAAGMDKLLKERKKIGEIARGEARETKAFDLRAKYIIHTVGPVWIDGSQNERDILRNCYVNSLVLAKQLKCKSIAFPLISTGVYGFPKDEALEIAADSINNFLTENKMEVYLVVFDNEAFDLSTGFVSEVKAYVDENYVALANAYEKPRRLSANSISFRNDAMARPMASVMNEREEASIPDFADSLIEFEPVAKACSSLTSEKIAPKDRKTKLDTGKTLYPEDKAIAATYETTEKTFQEKLLELMDERNLTSAQVYTPVEISRQSFSKILCNKDYHPTKGTAVLFCLSLKLDLDQTLDLLARAGFTLSPCNKPDLVIKDCILKKQYNRVLIDITMDTIAHTTIKNMK